MRESEMTTHYLDIKTLPDPETGAAELIGALYNRLHGSFVHFKVNNIGVSFPQYSTNPIAIGNVLRLHGTEISLDQFMKQDWLKGLRDHVSASPTAHAPPEARHHTFTRKQFKTNVERLRRRRMRRKNETAEQAAAAIPDHVERQPNLPYVHLRSGSTGHGFVMHLERGKPEKAPVLGTFNSYGLSAKATVPWF